MQQRTKSTVSEMVVIKDLLTQLNRACPVLGRENELCTVTRVVLVVPLAARPSRMIVVRPCALQVLRSKLKEA